MRVPAHKAAVGLGASAGAQTPVWSEVRGGMVTWLGSFYLVALIPMILNAGPAAAPITTVAATALACATGSALFATVTRLPFAVGPGIVPASIVATFLASGIPWPVVLGIELLAGLAFIVLVGVGAVQAWMRHTPAVLRTAGQIAIGLYLFLAALRAAGLLASSTPLGLPHLDGPGLIFLGGLALVFALRRSRGLAGHALWVGMLAASAAAAWAGLSGTPASPGESPGVRFTLPDVVSALDLRYLDEGLILLYVVVVDVIATLDTIATCSPALRRSDGQLHRFERALCMSAVVFTISPLLGTAPMLVLFENLGGVLSGARRSLAGWVSALGFAGLLFVAPLAQVVPAFACAVALAYVGYSITKFAAMGLSPQAAGPQAATVGRHLVMLAVVVMTASHSVALTMFLLFAAYPVSARVSGLSLRAGDLAAAALSLGLTLMMLG